MCGIYGYIQSEKGTDALKACIKGLIKLQYRGYDSSGVASIYQGSLISYKTVGKADLLYPLIENNTFDLDLAIAHTRWATHGESSKENAHPQIDHTQSIALVHNGIIENYLDLKGFLLSKNIPFTSGTDTEVVTNLISFFYEGDLKIALDKALLMVEGSFAIVLIHKDSPNTIYGACRNAPLVVGMCNQTKDVYIASDASSFSSGSYQTYILENNEIVEISPSTLKVYTEKGVKRDQDLHSLTISEDVVDKKHYSHFMLKEIHEQEFLCKKLLQERCEMGSFIFKELQNDDKTLLQAEHIDIIACGSSFHAGLIAKPFLEELSLVPVTVHLASEYRYQRHLKKKGVIAIFISQSGETADTLSAMRYQKASFDLTIALCNVGGSTLTRECDRWIPLGVGKEVSVCSTKAFTGQLLHLYLLAIHLGNVKKVDTTAYSVDLKKIPKWINDLFSKEIKIKEAAKKFSHFPHFFFTGRSTMFPVSKEAALKLKEITYLPAEAIPSGEMKHGPIALIDEYLPTIAFLGEETTAIKTLSNLHEIKARKGPLLIFGPHTYGDLTNNTISLPSHPFSSITYCIAGQLFAYYMALFLNKEIDFPRNLAKSVTVE
jgi:glucosamine--fructose-6-phosphate aminotransferase (isomerizing)